MLTLNSDAPDRPATRTHWPVVVVGAGPTGLTLAGLLARYGIEVLLVERNASTVEEPRAVSIDDESLRTMQAVGVVDAVLETVVLGYGSHYFSPAGRCFLKVEPTATDYGYPRRNAFRQPVLEAQLRRHLAAQGAVSTWFEAELVGFAQEAEQVSLRVRRADGALAELSCRYLVGCDGGRSFVRQALGIEMAGSSFRERWLIVDLEETKDGTRDTKVFCNPARPCLTLPGPSRTRRFEFMLHEGENDEAILAPDSVARLLRLYGVDDASPIRRKTVYTFHARMAEHWRQGRVFLAGDAAHLSPPFAGQGMNSGVRDAHNLAWNLAAVLKGELGAQLLDSYERERRGHAWDMIRLAMRMGRVMMPRSRASALAMEWTFRLLGLYPPARDYFAQMKYKPKPRFRAGFVAAEQAAERKDAGVGALFPQTRVTTAAGERLLDDLLGDGFSLVAPPGTSPALFGEVPEDALAPLAPHRVAVLAASEPTPAMAGVETAEDIRGELARLLDGRPPGLLLLRPDRYVAGFLPAGGIAASARRLGALVRGTRPEAPPGSRPHGVPATAAERSMG
jgi:3-(3-hydroxy-phenyl)propionate hydroxylase